MPEAKDRADVRRRYEAVIAAASAGGIETSGAAED